MTTEELKSLALDIRNQRIFGSWNIDNKSLIPNVFMPIVFMKPEDIESMQRENIVHLYEYIDKAGPMGVNGMPCFFSMRLMSKQDWELICPMIKELIEADKKFVQSK